MPAFLLELLFIKTKDFCVDEEVMCVLWSSFLGQFLFKWKGGGMKGIISYGGRVALPIISICLTVFFIFSLFSRAHAASFSISSVKNILDISVMEVEGNYDAKLPGGTFNTLPREEIAKHFFKTHPDNYDFLVIFSNFDFQMPQEEADAFYLSIKNDVQGIGSAIFDNSSSFGSNTRLQGTIDMGNLSAKFSDPLAPGFSETMGVLSHELLHRWAAKVKFKDFSGLISNDLIGKEGHWSFLLDTAGSLEYGNRWLNNGDGTFTSLPGRKYFSPLDLYLMGLGGKNEVPPMLLIDSPGIDPARLPASGVSINGTARQVTIDQIIAAEGERLPGPADSQKIFNIGCLYLTRTGTYNPEDLHKIRAILKNWEIWFSSLTNGKAAIYFAQGSSGNLATNPGPVLPEITTRILPPELNDAIAWLINKQQTGGQWLDSQPTLERDTTAALLALKGFPSSADSIVHGTQSLSAFSLDNMDYLARRILSQSALGDTSSALVDELVNRRNPDGGWGSRRNYVSNPLDTAIVLKALATVAYPDSSVIFDAITYLWSRQHSDGGWGKDDGLSDIQTTANVLAAYGELRQDHDLEEQITSGCLWLQSRQDSEGGFGLGSDATIYETAIALMAMKKAGGLDHFMAEAALGYLLERQGEDGSWSGRVYDTALAVQAIWMARQEPDLSVSPADITLEPAIINRLPSQVSIDVEVVNNGLTGVTGALVALYDGAISSTKLIAEQVVEIEGGASAKVSFSLAITDGASHQLFIAVDPYDEIGESNESNNRAMKTIYPDDTYELVLRYEDVRVAPGTLEVLQPVNIAGSVANFGTLDVFRAPLRITLNDGGLSYVIGTLYVDIPAGTSTAWEITWLADRPGPAQTLTVEADPFNSLTELSETNNSASVLLSINPSTKPNLYLDYRQLTITPSPAGEGGDASISFPVSNNGFADAENVSVEISIGASPSTSSLLRAETIPIIEAGSSFAVNFNWSAIPVAGDQFIYVKADPANAIEEISEADNNVFVPLEILSLPDLVLENGSVQMLPAFPKTGDPLTLVVTIRNTGAQAATEIQVVLYLDGQLRDRGVVPIIQGFAQESLVFAVSTEDFTDFHELRIEVDQENAITEQNEENNSITKGILFQNADLWLSERYISPNGDNIQDATLFFFRLASPQTVIVKVVDEQGETARTFAGEELADAGGGNLTWDGLDDLGRVVPDGDYRITVVAVGGEILARLPVTVDNNRSPFSAAVGDEGNLLQRNLTCVQPEIPQANDNSTWPWQWFSDESGIIFHFSGADAFPQYPAGIYVMSPFGNDAFSFLSSSWRNNQQFEYSFESASGQPHAISPDEESVAFIVRKRDRFTGSDLNELWVGSLQGQQPLLIDSYPQEVQFGAQRNPATDDVVSWSPDGSRLAYFITEPSYWSDAQDSSLVIAKTDGTDKVIIDFSRGSGLGLALKWSPDSKHLAFAYQNNYGDRPSGLGDTPSARLRADGSELQQGWRLLGLPGVNNLTEEYKPFLHWNEDSEVMYYMLSESMWGFSRTRIIALDSAGNNTEVFSSNDEIRYDPIDFGHQKLSDENDVVKLDHKTLLLREGNSFSLIDLSGNAPAILLSPNFVYEVAVNPESPLIAFFEKIGSGNYAIKTCNREGVSETLHQAKVISNRDPMDLRWSPLGDQLAFVEEFCFAEDVAGTCAKVGERVVVIDPVSRGKKFFDLGASDAGAGGNGAGSMNNYAAESLQWLKDGISLIGANQTGEFAANTDNNSLTYLPIDPYYAETLRISPLGNYLTYYAPIQPTSSCARPGKYKDLWSLSSLLNLTADLQVVKGRTAVQLNGVATDLNFAGYVLEYADQSDPAIWHQLAPPADVPVVNGNLATWIPPGEGEYLVRLSVFDKAGNVATKSARVSWGAHSSVINLYRTLKVFSPNGDGIQDLAELHYTVVDPVRLEFLITDKTGRLLKAIHRNHEAPGPTSIAWDGRDENGHTLPDGDYIIQVFDYRFDFRLDNTPPSVALEISGLGFNEIGRPFVNLYGIGLDANLKQWIIEYNDPGESADWHELFSGTGKLERYDKNGQLQPVTIHGYQDYELDLLVGKRLRVTVEDQAGNRSVTLANLIEEVFILNRWDNKSLSLARDADGQFFAGNQVPADLLKAGLHALYTLDTFDIGFSAINLQYRADNRWVDLPPLMNPQNSIARLPWDTSTLDLQKVMAVRARALDLAGQEYYSNPLYIQPEEFSIAINCTVDASGKTYLVRPWRISLLDNLLSSKLQFHATDDDSGSWTDFYLASGGSLFTVDIYPLLGDNPYQIRMVGETDSGREVVSGSVSYPPYCLPEPPEPPEPPECEKDGEPIIPPLSLVLSLSLTGEENFSTTCNSQAPGSKTYLATLGGLAAADIIPRELRYELVAAGGGSSLLRSIDLAAGEPWDELTIDTSIHAEGHYQVKATLFYTGDGGQEENRCLPTGNTGDGGTGTATAWAGLSIDRTLPQASLTLPRPGASSCLLRKSAGTDQYWYGLDIQGLVGDDREFKRFELFYGAGDDPLKWQQALDHNRRPLASSVPLINNTLQGSLGLWDVTSIPDGIYTLMLKVYDTAGNLSCATVTFPLFPDFRKKLQATSDYLLISPNADGVADGATISTELAIPASYSISVYQKDARRGILNRSEPRAAGANTFRWDGSDGAGGLLPDGDYRLVIEAVSECGYIFKKELQVVIDNTPPTAFILAPAATGAFPTVAEITGTASDPHFNGYELRFESVAEPAAVVTLGRISKPVADGVLGQWNNYGLEGLYQVKLVVDDLAGNRAETSLMVDLGLRTQLIKAFSITPNVFSPNQDGALDTTLIRFETSETADIRLEVFTAGHSSRLARDIAGQPPMESGRFTWDGRTDIGDLVSDGDYETYLTARLAADPNVSQTLRLSVSVDNTPPMIDFSSPTDSSYLGMEDLTVRGTISDTQLTAYEITLSETTGEQIWQTSGSENWLAQDFTGFSELTDGTYRLKATAADLAGNAEEKTLEFVYDRTPPVPTLDTADGQRYFGGIRPDIGLQGGIVEANLAGYKMVYGLGESPAKWLELYGDSTPPGSETLFAWAVGKERGIADGLYTLALQAKDKTGWEKTAAIQVIVDNTPPLIAVDPGENGTYVKKGPWTIGGSAQDPNYAESQVEIAATACLEADKWSSLRKSLTPISVGTLAEVPILPPDGVYCLRLTAKDLSGNEVSTKREFIVDTIPPAPPVLTGKITDKVNVALNWEANSEVDLAGYNLYRNGEKLNLHLLPITPAAYADLDLKEGLYRYTLTAVDLAGWESRPSGELPLMIDITPPATRIGRPADLGQVSGFTEVSGTAYSRDDFREFRLYLGQGEKPADWQLLARSPVPTTFAKLGEWNTLNLAEDISYSLKLEAEDLAGNIGSHQIAVRVDNTPPPPPLLLAVDIDPLVANAVNLAWQSGNEAATPAADQAGYLLYRNNRLANTDTAVSGELMPYLLAGDTYHDSDLPDGDFEYFLVAMDKAGNLGSASNRMSVTVDTRAPQARIVTPVDGSTFDQTLMLKAETEDLDIASVLFQYRPTGSGDWLPLPAGELAAAPYITYFNPLALDLLRGDYQIRALATDQGGARDPAPEFITVSYCDLTPPVPPASPQITVSGGRIDLSWTASQESDLAGYHLYQLTPAGINRLNQALLGVSDFSHTGSGEGELADGEYLYQLTSVDLVGNESLPSPPVSGLVYQPRLASVYLLWELPELPVTGSGATPGDQVELLLHNGADAASLATTIADQEGNFSLPVTGLSEGENRLHAVARDQEGNTSKISSALPVLFNLPPAAPTGLIAEMANYDTALAWNANGESDLAGYNLYRNGEKLNQAGEISGLGTVASIGGDGSAKAVDGLADTYWRPDFDASTASQWLQVTFPAEVLPGRVELDWYSGAAAGQDFKLLVLVGQHWVTVAEIAGNQAEHNDIVLSRVLATTALRLEITGPAVSPADGSTSALLAEIRVYRENPLQTASYLDHGLRDGKYDYQVAALDRYGLESARSEEAPVEVGDVVAPEPPSALVAVAAAADINLGWSASPAEDLAGYRLYRLAGQEWQALTVEPLPTTSFQDLGLRNGAYQYRVTAVDLVGNESLPSTPAGATVAIQLDLSPGSLSIVASAEGEALELCWHNEPGAAGILYRGPAPGGPYSQLDPGLTIEACHHDGNLRNGIIHYYVATRIDDYGNETSFSTEVSGIPSRTIPPAPPVFTAPTVSGLPLAMGQTLVAIHGLAEPAATVALYRDGIFVAATRAAVESRVEGHQVAIGSHEAALTSDGRYLAMSNPEGVHVLELASGRNDILAAAGEELRWSPSGDRLVYSRKISAGVSRLTTYAPASGESMELSTGLQVREGSPSWSADGGKLAFYRENSYTGNRGIWLRNMFIGTEIMLVADSGAEALSLAPDSKQLAYVQGGILKLLDCDSGGILVIADNLAWSSLSPPIPAWSPSGASLAYAAAVNNRIDLFKYTLASGVTDRITDSTGEEFSVSWSPDGQRLLYSLDGQPATPGIWQSAAEGQGSPTLLLPDPTGDIVHFSWLPSGLQVSITDGGLLQVLSPAGRFSLSEVSLSQGDNLFTAFSHLPGLASEASESILLQLDPAAFPDLEVAATEIYIFPAMPVAGEITTIGGAINNRGAAVAENVTAELYLWNEGGSLELLKRFLIPLIPPGSTAYIQVSWDSNNHPGNNYLYLLVDPAGTIPETDESNNLAASSFRVAAQEGLALDAVLNRLSFSSHDYLNLDIALANSGPPLACRLTTTIEDENGYPVTELPVLAETLDYGATANYLQAWPTGASFAGNYRVRLRLSDGSGGLREERFLPFTIRPDLNFAAHLASDRLHYGAEEQVALTARVDNLGANYIVPTLAVRLAVSSPAGELFSTTGVLTGLANGSTGTLSFAWPTGLSAPGDYQATITVFHDGRVVARASRAFIIDPVLNLSGLVRVNPRVVPLGSPVQVEYGVSSRGNVGGGNLSFRLALYDKSSQQLLGSRELLLALGANGGGGGVATFPATLPVGAYRLALYRADSTTSEFLAGETFSIIDSSAPVLELIEPTPGTYYRAPALVVRATDEGGQVSAVEYRLDGGGWRPLPLVDPVGSTHAAGWPAAVAAEGEHLLEFRASDQAGNVSEVLVSRITIELCQPFSELTGTLTYTPQPLYYGQRFTLPFTLRNACQSELPGLEAELQVFDARMREMISDAITLDLGPGTELTREFSIDSLLLGEGLHQARLVVTTAGEAEGRTLASLAFELLPPLKFSLSPLDQANLLVWLNYQAAGPCQNPAPSPANPEGLCVDSAALGTVLDRSVDNYWLAQSREEFEEELRNPYYSDFLILGDQHLLTDHLYEELREKVYAGAGLLASGWLPSGAPEAEDLLGVKGSGRLSDMPVLVQTESGLLGPATEFPVEGMGWRVEPTPAAEALGWLLTAGRHGKDGDADDRYPALLLHDYGLGRTLYLAFDLGASLDGGDGEAGNLLSGALSHLHASRPSTNLTPYEPMPMRLTVTSPGRGFDLALNGTCPADLALYDQASGTWTGEGICLQTPLSVAAGGAASLPLYLMPTAPAAAYTLALEAVMTDAGSYLPLQSAGFVLAAAPERGELLREAGTSLAGLEGDRPGRVRLENAGNYLEKVAARQIYCDRDLLKNIGDLGRAISELLAATGCDVEAVRLRLGELLRGEEARWYFYQGPPCPAEEGDRHAD